MGIRVQTLTPSVTTPCRPPAPADPRDVVERLAQDGVHLGGRRHFSIPLLRPAFVALAPQDAVARLSAGREVYVQGVETKPFPLDGMADLATLSALHLGTPAAQQPALAQALYTLQREGFRFMRSDWDTRGKWQPVDPLALQKFADRGCGSNAVRIAWQGHELLATREGVDVARMANVLGPGDAGPLKTLLQAGYHVDFSQSHRSGPGADAAALVVWRNGNPFPVPLSRAGDLAFVDARAATVATLAKSAPSLSFRHGETAEFFGHCLDRWPGQTPEASAGRLTRIMQAEAQAWPEAEIGGDDRPSQWVRTRRTLSLLETTCPETLLDGAIDDWLAMSGTEKEDRRNWGSRDFKDKALESLRHLYRDVRNTSPDFVRDRASYMRLVKALDSPTQAMQAFDSLQRLGADDALEAIEQARPHVRPDAIREMLGALEKEVLVGLSGDDRRQAARTAWYLLRHGGKATEAASATMLAIAAVGRETLETRLGVLCALAETCGPDDAFGPYTSYQTIVRAVGKSGHLQKVAADFLTLLRALAPAERRDGWAHFQQLCADYRSQASRGTDFPTYLNRFLEAHLLTGDAAQARKLALAAAEPRPGGTVQQEERTVVINGIRVQRRA